jgi:hypothetical protein
MIIIAALIDVVAIDSDEVGFHAGDGGRALVDSLGQLGGVA